jgi:hypothetical protein
MVRTSDNSQCCAVAVPWAWKARRMGCEGESLGGSVVLLLLSWLPLRTRGLERCACSHAQTASVTYPRSG